MSIPTDEVLMLRLQEGDPAALGLMYQRLLM